MHEALSLDFRRYAALGLSDVAEKVTTGERLSLDDGARLFDCPDSTAVGALAHFVRTCRHGDRAHYVVNRHINYTNVCVNGCLFCAYRRDEGQTGAFELNVDDIVAKACENPEAPVSEIHIVGGCHPRLPLAFFEEALSKVRAARPQALLKCFTTVEIRHFADLEGISVEEVLARLKTAGLSMLPGGGAEIFDPAVREQICPKKIDGAEWLRVAGAAHRLGIPSNATMLFGHLETRRHRLEHLDALRRQQDETGGFTCFIPLPFQTKNSRLQGITPVTGLEMLRTIAVSRLMLDNIPHVKAYWIMLGVKTAQAALHFGADDLDGTVVEEKIGHMAGASSEAALTRAELEEMIRRAGFTPVIRDAKFNELTEAVA